jgi:hypothetical protein
MSSSAVGESAFSMIDNSPSIPHHEATPKQNQECQKAEEEQTCIAGYLENQNGVLQSLIK